MSFTDSQAEGVQPSEGQGADSGGNPAYAEYLDRIPNEARGVAEEAFKAWDQNVQQRFTSAAEAQKGWEPYEQAGVKQYDPEVVQQAIQLYQAAQDPQSFHQWVNGEYAQHYGIEAQQAPEQQGVSFDEFGGGFDPQALEQMLSSKLSPLEQQIQQFHEWRQQQEQQGAEQQAQQFISGQIAELKQKHADVFKDTSDFGPDKMLDRFASAYIETDPQNAIPRGFQDYLNFRNQIEKGTLEGKLNQPKPPEGGGQVNTQAPSMDRNQRMAEAMRMLRESTTS